PLRERAVRSVEEPLDFLRLQFLSERQRRQPRLEQNFIRVGIADPAEKPGVGKRALQRVVGGRQSLPETRRVRCENFQPSGIERLKSRLACHQMERGTLLRAGLGPKQGSVGKVKRSQSARWGYFAASFFPMQASRDHEVQHEPNVVLEADGDALAKTPKFPYPLSLCARKRRGRGAQKKWTGDSHLLKLLAKDPFLQGFDINGDVGEFRHFLAKGSELQFSDHPTPRAQAALRMLVQFGRNVQREMVLSGFQKRNRE